MVLAALAALGVMLWFVARGKRRITTQMLAQGALCMALAFVLSYVRLHSMPMGGSITLASMLPIFLFGYLYGPRMGVLVGMAYGLLQMIQDPDILHPVQVLLDYPLAFGMLGLAGVLPGAVAADANSKIPLGLLAGMLIGVLGRGLWAVLSGVVFWGMYAPEGTSPLVYSLGYNLTYLIPDAAICGLLCLIPGVMTAVKRLKAI